MKRSALSTVFTAMLLVSLAIPLAAGDQPENTLTPELIAQIQYVREAAISPDGQLIAYVKRVPRDPFNQENGSAWQELWVTDREGDSRPFITGEVDITSIAFTPDGKFISYLAERGDDEDDALYKIAVDGGESQKVIGLKSDIKGYSWAPDSRRVAFRAKKPLSDELDSLEEIGFEQEVYEEEERNVEVYIYDSGGNSAEPRCLNLEGSATELHWSPDGGKLGMALAPTSLIDDFYVARKVYMISPETGEVIHRFDNPGQLGPFAWSPDGAYLAIRVGVDIHDPESGELWLAEAATGELKPVMTDLDGHISQIEWKDNQTLLYVMDQHVHTPVGMVKIDGTGQKTLIPSGRPVFTKMCVSADGKYAALVGHSPTYDAELFLMKVGEKIATRLTECNPWLADLRLAPQEVIKHTARDGLELEGILIRPLDEEPGKRYPLILQVHGGPEAHRRDGWLTWYSSPGQMAAARGFAVFYPNYRGSTGRGVEFAKLGQAGYAEGEFNDLVDAVDHLVEIGMVDKDKVGITGGSYGGYASAWGATALTEHFAASVMGFGVSDLISKFGTTDIPNEMYYIHAQSWPWERWQWYLEQSPIYHAEKARTPILILHGEDDPRVHPSQSMELYRYLKTLDQVPVRLVFYKDEEHGNSKAAARYDYSLRQIRWMEHYLKGPGGDMPPYELDYSALKGE